MNTANDQVLTLDALMEMFEQFKQMPSPPFLASSMMFESGKALKFTAEGCEYCGAHPSDWKKATDDPAGPPLTLFGESMIVDLDTNARERARFYKGMQRAFAEHNKEKNNG